MMTNTDGARWRRANGKDQWLLIARKRDGGSVLACIERCGGEYLWGLGTGDLENAHSSFYAAQRAVRRELKEQSKMSKPIALPGANCREALTVQQQETSDTLRLEFHGAGGVVGVLVVRWKDNFLGLEGWTHENIIDEDKRPNIDRGLYDANEEAG
jgi:hypothetical protein